MVVVREAEDSHMVVDRASFAFARGILVLLLCSLWAAANAQTTGITRGEDSMKIDLGYGIVINKDSTLKRQIVTIHNSTQGAVIVGEAPIVVRHVSKKYRGEFTYEARWTVLAKVDLHAVETRFLIFDLWRDGQRTLSATKIKDITAGMPQEFTAKWRVWNENEAIYHNASIAYIAQVRTADGKIWQANVKRVLEEAKRFVEAFKQDQLKPTRPTGPRK